jgi:hypothetical protein
MRIIFDWALSCTGKWINPFLGMDTYARKLFLKRNKTLMGIWDASYIWRKLNG